MVASQICKCGFMAITVQPVNEALFDDVQKIFGRTGQAARCQCQGYRMGWYAQHSDMSRAGLLAGRTWSVMGSARLSRHCYGRCNGP